MKAIVFAPLVSEHPDRHDAPEFLLQARAFAALHGVPSQAVQIFDNSHDLSTRAAQVTRALAEYKGLDCVAFCCHGWAPPGTPEHPVHTVGIQAGWLKSQIPQMAEALKEACAPAPVIALFCCSTAQDDKGKTDDTLPAIGGEAGFADWLRRELVKLGVRPTIFAHASRGHCVQNPYLRRFLPDELAGGEWVIAPKSELWHVWVPALVHTDLALRVPLMAQADIEAELRASVHHVAE